MPALTAAPSGFRWVKNRLGRSYDGLFDGQTFVFAPQEERLMTTEIAEFLHNQSLISINASTYEGTRALALDGSREFEEPITMERPLELLDRSDDDNPIGRGTGGLKTHAAQVRVRGGGRTTG